MDFIRATIKAAFYDYPIGSVLNYIRNNNLNDFCKTFPEIMRWTVPEFTVSELSSLKDVVCQQWMRKTQMGDVVQGPELSRVFLLLNQFSKEVFANELQPTIGFEHLLRWNALSHYIGEDILVCPYLAEKDMMTGIQRISFIWPDVLPHDNKELYQLLDNGLADVHAHLFASTDVFAENWLSLMNRVAIAKSERNKSVLVDLDTPYQDFDISINGECNFLSLHHLGIVAAAIRVMMCRLLFQGIKFDYSMISDMLQSPSLCIDRFNEIRGMVADLAAVSLKNSECKVFDYAINSNDIKQLSKEEIVSPYMMHYGERRMLYIFFRKYYSGDDVIISLAPILYLYLLIKTKYRREFVQTNPLNGFDNFKRYQDRKCLFSHIHVPTVAYRYAVQTAIGKDVRNSIEARITEGTVKMLRNRKIETPLFGGGTYFKRSISDNYRLLVHFIKKRDHSKPEVSSCRYSKERLELYKEMNLVFQDVKRNVSALKQGKPALVGIDAAGSELNCRPELFAPYFRWAQLNGLTNVTYHAGEDFYDLIDGLRTIDEAILFMQYQRGNRIGHALALGVDAHSYYNKRHFNAIMPTQYMLDNMVWIYYKAKEYNLILSPETESYIDFISHILLREIGYGEDVDRFYYWQSMRLRGDRLLLEEKDEISNHTFGLAALCSAKECVESRKSETARKLHEMYETDPDIRKNGACPDYFVLPKSIADDVTKLQDAMMRIIEKRGIYIECCPSSNLVIGPFSKYEELPILRFMSVAEPYNHRINVSINTDDRGVFATSLRNEFSLMAIAMMKMKDANNVFLYTNETILEYIKKIIKNAEVQMFDVPKMLDEEQW